MPRHDPDQKTKQNILNTAMRLFSEKGLENVSVEDVVTEVGVTRGAFYHYFKSREELITGVMDKAFHDNNPFLLLNVAPSLNALEKLRYIFKHDLRSHLEMSDSLRAEMQQVVTDDPVVFKNDMISQVNVIAPYIEKILDEGNEDGSISVKYPKQVSQMISLLTSTWLNPFIFWVPQEEYLDKVSFLEQLGSVLGVPFMDEEMREIFLGIYELEIKNRK